MGTSAQIKDYDKWNEPAFTELISVSVEQTFCSQQPSAAYSVQTVVFAVIVLTCSWPNSVRLHGGFYENAHLPCWRVSRSACVWTRKCDE